MWTNIRMHSLHALLATHLKTRAFAHILALTTPAAQQKWNGAKNHYHIGGGIVAHSLSLSPGGTQKFPRIQSK